MPVFKVRRILEQKTEEMTVFYGPFTIDPNIEWNSFRAKMAQGMKEMNYVDHFLKQVIFTSQEVKNILQNNIRIRFSKQQIHLDDTIGTIKIKLLMEFPREFSLDEIFLFWSH